MFLDGLCMLIEKNDDDNKRRLEEKINCDK
jgi:hypothetical protein